MVASHFPNVPSAAATLASRLVSCGCGNAMILKLDEDDRQLVTTGEGIVRGRKLLTNTRIIHKSLPCVETPKSGDKYKPHPSKMPLGEGRLFFYSP